MSDHTRILTRPFTFELLRIPSGDFIVGYDWERRHGHQYPWERSAAQNSLPEHSVFLAEYEISKYPITNAQYVVFVRATGHRVPGLWNRGQITKGMEDHPVVEVSWYDAVAFCDWLGRETGLAIGLPSDLQWEKAARGTDGRTYPWGNEDPDDSRCNFNSQDLSTTPVWQYPKGASPYGIMDMSGNVWEWCRSKFTRHDGWSPVDVDDSAMRVLRGGVFATGREDKRSYARSSGSPGHRDVHIGFRVATMLGYEPEL